MSKQLFFNPFTKQSEGEILMEKNPMASSPNLIEYFLIMGYEESYIQEKIIKNFSIQTQTELELAEQKNKKLNPESKILNEYKCRNLPSILFSLGSNFSEPLESEDDLIKDVFPVPPSVLYSIIDNTTIYEPMSNDVVFSNIQNTVVNIGYAHIFYESKNILENIRIYIPKAFVVISQYPFFNTFKSICMELLTQFKNKLIQIPLEIQLYNIINFIPAPIDSDISMTLFPSNELVEILNKCKNDRDLIHYNRQKEYILTQVSGYRETQVDISVIFCILSSDIIIEIFIQLLAGNTVAIFSNNVSLLNMTIFIFQEMFYPISNDESVKCLSPLKFFNSDMMQQNIVGFVCTYDDLETFEKGNPQYKTLCDDDEEQNEFSKMFDCDFILDLDKKKFEYLETDNSENVQKISDYVKKIISSHNKDSGTNFEKSLKYLYTNLNEIAFKLTYGNKNQVIPDYFVNENQFNRRIQNSFYSFMLNIAHEFFQSISKYTGDRENTRKTELRPKDETNLNDEEYLFFSLFSKTYYYKVLTNFIGGYSKGELLIYRTPKMIFENLMNIKKLEEKMNLSKLSDNFYELIDEIYGKTNNVKEISFLNFYKYYKEKMEKDIYDSVNNKIVCAKMNKQNKTNIKYYYEYYGINLDKNLIFEYKYLIDALPKNEINHIFNLNQNDNITDVSNSNNNQINTPGGTSTPTGNANNSNTRKGDDTPNSNNNQINTPGGTSTPTGNANNSNNREGDNNSYDIYRPIDLKITQRSIYNCIEQYFIKTKSIDHIAIINFSILNVVALTVYKRSAPPFILSIYELFNNLPCSIRKYQKIIFSIALRLIKTQKYNYQMLEKYFTIYEMSKDLGLFLNDQLIILLKEINELKRNNKTRFEEVFDERFKDIEKTEIKKLFSVECKKKPKDIIPILQMNINKPIPSSKLTFKSKFYNDNKKIEIKEQLSPIMIYNITNEMIESYLHDLDSEKINKTIFENIIIHLIYYTQILNDKFPKDINKFLFYCLDETKSKKNNK